MNTREPVAIGHAVTLVMAAVVALGWATWDNAVIASVASGIAVIVQLSLAMWARRSVTPLVEPLDNDGTPLVRVSPGAVTTRRPDLDPYGM